MKRFVFPALLLVLLFQFSTSLTAGQTPVSKATLKGAVVKATTGEPLPRAQVTITPIGLSPNRFMDLEFTPTVAGPNDPPPPPQAPAMIPAVTTDDEGKFVINDIPAGSYRVSAGRNGYAQQQFGQRSPGRPGTVLNIRDGQRVEDIAFRLIPAATIAGRVTDSHGDPLPGVTVQALRSTYDAAGKRSLQPAGTAKTNDLGEYRLYWINPGRYYVNANASPTGIEALSALSSQAMAGQSPSSPEEAQQMSAAQSILGPGKNPNEMTDTGLVVTYYPGTADVSRAAPLELQPGAEVRGIDFTLTRDRKVRIRGKVVDSKTGRPPHMAQVSVMSRDRSGGSPLDLLAGLGGALQGNTYNPATGEFEVKGVSFGAYWLQVTSQTQLPRRAGALPANEADELAILSSINDTRIPMDVYGSDIDNVMITVTPGIAIPGRIRLDGAQPSNLGQSPFANIRVSLTSGTGTSLLALLGGRGPKTAEDGTFSLERITPGDYKLLVSGLGPSMYIKEARLDQADILRGVTIGDRVNSLLEVTIGANAGEVAGTIMGADLKPVTGVQTVLIPDSHRDRHELYKTAITDQNGKVTLRGLTPGDYRLFAWEDIEPFSFFDPDVLKQYEQQGEVVHVKESSKETVDMKIISVPRELVTR